MKIACVCIASQSYLSLYEVHKNSVLKHIPEANVILYKLEDLWIKYKSNYENMSFLEFSGAIRPQVILDTFKLGYDVVIFCGADIIFYSHPTAAFDILEQCDVVITPHNTQPHPEDEKFPNNEMLIKAGHINSDFVIWTDSQEVRKFLNWQREMLKSYCTPEFYYDQGWLNCVPFFCNAHILKHPGYQVAYWNFKQRNLQLDVYDNTWWVDHNDFDVYSLVFFHFSGFDFEHPENISIHQNRYIAEGEFLNFLIEYKNNVEKFK